MPDLIVSLEYQLHDKIADKDICVDHIVAIERHDSKSVAVRFVNGYVAYLTPAVAHALSELWYSTTHVRMTINAEGKVTNHKK